MGALVGGGVIMLNDEVVEAAEVAPETIEGVAAREHEERMRRERAYRGERPALRGEGKTVFLVDDGLATGSSMRAAIAVLRERRPAQIVVAVPIAPPVTCEQLAARPTGPSARERRSRSWSSGLVRGLPTGVR
jgi:putative phosphoribosyl transferase